MREPVLFQNLAGSLILLDIPCSIEHGQATSASLLSSRAPNDPYPSTEPKGGKRIKLLNELSSAEKTYHNDIYHLLLDALQEAQVKMQDRDWCYPRLEAVQNKLETPAFTFKNNEFEPPLPGQVPLLLSDMENRLAHFTDLRGTIVVNSLRSATTLAVGCDIFHIPPRSTFVCSKVADTLPLLQQALTANSLFTGAENIQVDFDLVLLDPPWANRSVRHAKTYETADKREDPFEEILPFLKSHLKTRGIIAIWITNKASVRHRVLAALTMLGYQVFEELIWLKVTSNGKPVTELNGLWRKPYEILLLFAKATVDVSNIRRRVLVCVPDIHSRKPCLKSILEPLLPRPYRALEVFARNLVSGWWSWGDECLKYQHSNQWTSAEPRTTQ